jgi:hypothetical protein
MGKQRANSQIVRVESRILLVRGEKVIIDSDLAEFYGVSTKRLNEQVKRNRERFPEDFSFRLTRQEKAEVILACPHLEKLKRTKLMPRAFTEHGAIMAATVLNSGRAVEMSIFIVRAFVKLREAIEGHKELSHKLDLLERKVSEHDKQLVTLIKAIKQLISPKPVPKKRRIGFKVSGEQE